MNPTPPAKTNFKAALQRLGLTDAFVRLCREQPTIDHAGLVAWVKAQPGLSEIAYIPDTFRHLRADFDCRGPRGGLRTTRGKGFYRVTRSQHATV